MSCINHLPAGAALTGRRGHRALLAVGMAFCMSSSGLTAVSNDEKAYLAENDAAMSKMMIDMAVKPTGDVDRDFVAMMIPHHQGAIDMAQAVLRYGHNEQIRRIAQEIIVDQIQEIAAMRLAVGEPLPPSKSSPTQVPPAGVMQSIHTHQER
jgi:Domain of unknown function (DUF305)